jgi:hypothetical protein
MLLNSILTISSKAMSRYPTGIAVTSEGLWEAAPPPAMRLHLPAMVHQLRFLIQHLHPPRGSHPMRFTLTRETTSAVSIAQHPASVLTHASEPVLRFRLEAMQVWRPSARRNFPAEYSCVALLPLRQLCDHG